MKEINWLKLSIAEKEHIRNKLQERFSKDKFGVESWGLEENDFFIKFNKKLTVTTENKKFSAWAAKKTEVIHFLDSYGVNIDFNKPKEVLDFARYFPTILFSAGSLLESKSFALDALRIKPKLLPFLNDKLRNNESIIRAAITTYKNRNNSKLLRYASERLRGSKKFMKEMIDTCPGSFPFLSKKLRNDKELIDIYKSRIRYIKSVDDLSGLPAMEKLKIFNALEESGIRGISINWLKRQPEVLREDKEVLCKVMFSHAGYNPFLFPQFDKIKEYYKGSELYKDVIKFYLVALFITFQELLRQDQDGAYVRSDRSYKSDAEIREEEVPFRIKSKSHSRKVLDLVFNCLGHEGLVYSQKIDLSAAFLPPVIEDVGNLRWYLERLYEGNNTQGIEIEFQKAMRQFYDFIQEHAKISLFELALHDKDTIPSDEFNYTKTTQKIQDEKTLLDIWLIEEGSKTQTAVNNQVDIPF